MGAFENTLKHIILKPFKPMGAFENTLKQIILKYIKIYGEFWKHFETHNLKTIETYGVFWKHFETHNLKTIETYGDIWKHFKTDHFENTLKHIISSGEAFYGLSTASSLYVHKRLLYLPIFDCKNMIWNAGSCSCPSLCCNNMRKDTQVSSINLVTIEVVLNALPIWQNGMWWLEDCQTGS